MEESEPHNKRFWLLINITVSLNKISYVFNKTLYGWKFSFIPNGVTVGEK